MTAQLERLGLDPHEAFEVLFDLVEGAVCLVTPDGLVARASQGAVQLFGGAATRPGSALERCLADQASRAALARCLSGEGGSCEVVASGSLGEPRPVLLSARPLRSVRGEHGWWLVGFFERGSGVCTPLPCAAFRRAVESMQIGVTVTDLDRIIRYVNPAEAAMHGYEREELIGQPASVLGVSPGTAEAPPAADGGTSWRRESINRRKDGSRIAVRLFSDPLRDHAGRVVGMVTCSQDLANPWGDSDLAQRLQRAVEQSPALVIITDTQGRIEYVNPQFTAVTGYEPEEVLGQNPRVLKSGELPSEVYRELWETITRGGTWRGEFHNRRKDGTLYWALAAISGLVDDRGNLRHFIGVQEDITRRKDMERELEAKSAELARLNQFKSDMVAITSHDLRSPLNGMIALANLLRDRGESLDAAARARLAGQIASAGQRLAAYVGDLLDVERLHAGRLTLEAQEVPLDEVVRAAAALVASELEARRQTLELTGTDCPLRVLGDRLRLERVLLNLLTNASKFSPRGSVIEVGTETREGWVEIAVADCGPGIPEEDLERVFERYYQAGGGHTVQRSAGAGLGLFICRELVRLHGGSITVTNRPEGGCRFVVSLPAPKAGRQAPQLRVLVEEAPPVPADMLDAVLGRTAAVTRIAGRDRLEALLKQPEPFDVAFVSAATAAALSRGKKQATRLVAIAEDASELRHASIDDVLLLPLSYTELAETVRAAVVARREGASDLRA